MTVIPIVIGSLGTATKGLVHNLKIKGRVGTIETTAQIEISQNTEKGSGDLRRFVVTQTPVRNHWLTLM